MSSPETKPVAKKQPVKIIPSVRNIAPPQAGYLDLINGGYYWYAHWADLGFTLCEGRYTEKDVVERYYVFGGPDSDLIMGRRYTRNQIMLEYWKQRPEAYLSACKEQDVIPMDLWPEHTREVRNA